MRTYCNVLRKYETMKSQTEIPDLVILEATVITMDQNNSVADAIAIKKQKILDVGENEKIRRRIGSGTKVLHWHGKTILPGFIDSHSHILFGGFTEKSINLADVRSINDILEKISSRLSTAPAGQWVHGTGYSIDNLSEKDIPQCWIWSAFQPKSMILMAQVYYL